MPFIKKYAMPLPYWMRRDASAAAAAAAVLMEIWRWIEIATPLPLPSCVAAAE